MSAAVTCASSSIGREHRVFGRRPDDVFALLSALRRVLALAIRARLARRRARRSRPAAPAQPCKRAILLARSRELSGENLLTVSPRYVHGSPGRRPPRSKLRAAVPCRHDAGARRARVTAKPACCSRLLNARSGLADQTASTPRGRMRGAAARSPSGQYSQSLLAADERFRAVVDVHENGVEAGHRLAKQIGHIADMHAAARVRERMAGHCADHVRFHSTTSGTSSATTTSAVGADGLAAPRPR